MAILAAITRLLIGDVYSTNIGTPTGCTAGACGGETIDSLLHFSRTSFTKKYTTIQDKKLLADLQRKHRNTLLCLFDEIYMWGSGMYGIAIMRMADIFNLGKFANRTALMGGIPAVIVLGDPSQLVTN